MTSEKVQHQIADAVRRNDPSALELIWNAYSAKLFAFLLSILLHRADAEDALQNLFVRIARKRARLRNAANIKAYIFAMARNEAIELMRQRPRRTESLDVVAGDFLAVRDAQPEDEEPLEMIRAAMASLPEEQRDVVFLKIWRDMTSEAIGEFLAISQNTAASRYRYAIEKLRERIRAA